MCGKRTCPTPQVSKRRDCQRHCHWDSTPRPLDRHSRSLTTELQPATCGKLRCWGRLGSFLTNRFICLECYSNIERINEGMIIICKARTTRRLPETPLSLSQWADHWRPRASIDLRAYWGPWRCPRRGRQLSRVIQLKIHGNYRSCIHRVATVIQREREALTNMAAG